MSKVNTSKQWATLPSFVSKLNKKLPKHCKKLSPKATVKVLKTFTAAQLRQFGIWITYFGKKYMPIVLVNPSFRRALLDSANSNTTTASTTTTSSAGTAPTCSCGVVQPKGKGDGKQNNRGTTAATQRFFGSHDYNAGRHCPTNSAHRPTCLCWAPPTTGHLHSWRRGYEE